MATSRKIGFFLRKKPRSPTGERARNVLRTMPSVSPEIARKPARHPALAAGRCLPRVCVCGGARWACRRVGVCVCRACARRARRARSRRRSRRFCRKSVDPSVFPPYLQEGVRINMRGYAARRPAKHFSANEKKDYTVSRCPAPGGCGRAVKGRELPSGIPGLPPGTYILYPVRKNFSRRQI